ncbi:DUF2142 domain-containing protein [Streptococcus panodentis]|uniref:DUF2142 domain-containing protein n=1 Tax=Streptococcus panodentis TaxID=1581472 RepID=A0ABS5AZ67_9STRE|nr:hypothetical protein [Streptococcus panodentis]
MKKIEKLLGIKDQMYARHICMALCISFIVSLGSVFYRNPGSWMDEPFHYYRAIQISNGDIYKNDNGNMALFGGQVSETQLAFMNHFVEKGTKDTFGFYFLSEIGGLSYSETTRFQAATNAVPYHPLVYFPYVLVAVLNKALHLSPAVEFILMRLSGLIFAFSFLILAIRMMPFSKWTVAVLALHPTLLLTNSAISADLFTNAAVILFIACLTKVTYRIAKLRNITKLDAMQLALSILFVSLAKVPAFLILLSVLPVLYFAYKEKLFVRKIAVFLLFALTFSLLCSALLILLIKDVNTGAYFGRDVDTFKQLAYIFSDIPKFLSMYFREIFSYDYTVIQLGYARETFYQKPPAIVSMLYYFAYAVSWLYQERNYESVKVSIEKFKIIQFGKVASFLAILFATFLILYLQYSLVGSNIIDGVQQRYFTAYSLLLLTFIPHIRRLKMQVINWLVALAYFPLAVYLLYVFFQLF